MPNSFTSQPTISDLVKYEVNQDFTREVVSFTPIGAVAGRLVGRPVLANGAEVGAGGEANVAGLIISNEVYNGAAAVAIPKVLILRRGPALINRSLIATRTTANVSYNVANLVTALLALGIKVELEPTKQTEQLS